MWHEFDADSVAANLARVRHAGLEVVRVHLAWDAFMPSHRQVSRPRMRDLETLLEAARAVSLGVVPVLFAQSLGDCVMMPRFTVDRHRQRPGVRVISDQNVEPGGPRDVYADPLMLEAEMLWLDSLLDAFANHPAIAAWDLGHDPATAVRPRFIAQFAAWAELMAGRVRAREDACWLTLGASDLLTARAVRPHLVAPHLDALGIAIAPQRLAVPLGAGGADVGALVFLARLGQRLATVATDGPARVLLGIGVASGDEETPPAIVARSPEEPPPGWDVPLLDPNSAAGHAEEALPRLAEVGPVGLLSGAWCDTRERTFAAAPFDRLPSLGRQGLAGQGGELKPVGEVWSRVARSEPGLAAAAPWPDALDAEEFYANLPDSALELFTAWRRDLDEMQVS